MIRMPIAVACALLVAGSAVAQTPAPGGQTSSSTPAVTSAPQNPPTAPPKPAAPAQTPAAAPPLKPPVPFPTDSKIGFVNMQLVVALSELGKKGSNALKALTEKRTVELAAKSKAIVDLEKEIQQGQSVLSAATLSQKNLDAQRMRRELDLAQQNADAELTAMNTELLSSFSEKSIPVVEALAKEKGLYLVISEQSQVVYVTPAINLTDEVIKRLDAAFPKTPGKG